MRIKVSDYIVKFLASLGVRHVFTVSGAGNLHILDSIRRMNLIDYVCNHHEQACAMAMYGYARATENFGVCLVTTGPGGTNAITGVCSAWVDSIPCMVISGQVKRVDMIAGTRVRQRGIQEINITDIVGSITKFAITVARPDRIRYELERGVFLARSGRPGPVWVDVPMDIQTAMVEEAALPPFDEAEPGMRIDMDQRALRQAVGKTIELLRAAQRPIFLAGHGIRLARAIPSFEAALECMRIPVLTSWNGIDLLPSDHALYAGRAGVYGQRGANFAIQNCDLLLSVGARLSIPQTGYQYSEFARAARKIYVDIDSHELNKFSQSPDLAICADAKDFLEALLDQMKGVVYRTNIEPWRARCRSWRENYPVDLPEYAARTDYVNSFHFVSILGEELAQDEVIVPTASGSGFTSCHQALKVKRGQRCFTSNGFAEMGFDLPGAIGACFGLDKRRVVQMTGDGGLQMNLQELQTIVTHALPIKLFVFSNGGYLTIKHTENALFAGHQAGTGPESGVTLPDIQKIGAAFGLNTFRITNHGHMRARIREVLDASGPAICEVMTDPKQLLIPKTSFRQLPDGALISPPLEDLYPFLERDEFLANMIIPPLATS